MCVVSRYRALLRLRKSQNPDYLFIFINYVFSSLDILNFNNAIFNFNNNNNNNNNTGSVVNIRLVMVAHYNSSPASLQVYH